MTRVGDVRSDTRRGRVYSANIVYPLSQWPSTYRSGQPYTPHLVDNFHHIRSAGGVPHSGMDIEAPTGTHVRAPLTAPVVRSSADEGRHRDMGHFVWLRDPRGYTLKLMHFESAPRARVGETLTRAQYFADVGSTGNSIGPHLHFGVLDPDGREVNPYPALVRAFELEHIGPVEGARRVGAWEVPRQTGQWWFGSELPAAFVWQGKRFERSSGIDHHPGTRAHYREAVPRASRHLYVMGDGTYLVDHVDAYNPNASLCNALRHYWHDVRAPLDPVVSGARARARGAHDVGDAAADQAFSQSMALARNWARHYRVPREWWEGDDVRMGVARVIRERIQRDVPRIIEHAMQVRASGNVDGSDQIAARLVEYIHMTQRTFVRLMDAEDATLLGQASRAFGDLTDWAMGVAVRSGDAAAAGAATVASALSSIAVPVLLIAGGLYAASQYGSNHA